MEPTIVTDERQAEATLISAPGVRNDEEKIT
jgi:hypothetical protein